MNVSIHHVNLSAPAPIVQRADLRPVHTAPRLKRVRALRRRVHVRGARRLDSPEALATAIERGLLTQSLRGRLSDGTRVYPRLWCAESIILPLVGGRSATVRVERGRVTAILADTAE